MRSVKRQGGSVAVFMVVGVILVLVALGVIYGMKHVAMRDQTPPMILSGLSSGDDKSEESAESSDKPSQDDATSEESDKPAEDGGDSKAGEADGTRTEGSASSGGGASDGQSSSGSAEGLPQSGPAETIASMVALSAVVASTTAYIRSLRRL